MEMVLELIQNNKNSVTRVSIYIGVTTVFLFFLNDLNQSLFHQGLHRNAIKLILYHNGKPIIFFVIALLLEILGAYLIILLFKNIRTEYLETGDVLLHLILIGLIVIMIVLIFVFINNPILQAVAGVSFVGYVFIKAS